MQKLHCGLACGQGRKEQGTHYVNYEGSEAAYVAHWICRHSHIHLLEEVDECSDLAGILQSVNHRVAGHIQYVLVALAMAADQEQRPSPYPSWLASESCRHGLIHGILEAHSRKNVAVLVRTDYRIHYLDCSDTPGLSGRHFDDREKTRSSEETDMQALYDLPPRVG